jgi:hypothetical protein
VQQAEGKELQHFLYLIGELIIVSIQIRKPG